MWRWYVEIAFLVLLCFALGAGVAALVMAKVLPKAGTSSTAEEPGAGSQHSGGTS